MNRPLNKQITLRIIAALVAAVCTVAGATYVLNERAFLREREAEERETAAYFRERMTGLRESWMQAADEVRTSIEFANPFERSPGGAARLRAFFLSLTSGGLQFSNALVVDSQGKLIVHIGPTDAFTPPVPSMYTAGSAAWYFDSGHGSLYYIVKQTIWLGVHGVGSLVLFRPIDNALLREIAFPDTDLYLLWDGIAVASSRGQEGVDAFSRSAREATDGKRRDIIRMSIPWAADPASSGAAPVLAIRTVIPGPLPMKEVLLIVLAAVVVMAGLTRMLFTAWIVGVGKRIGELRNRVIRFTRERSPDLFAERAVGDDRSHRDEVEELDAAFNAMTGAVRSRERDLMLFRGLVRQTNDAIFICDGATARIIDANDRACAGLGYTREELLAKKVMDIDAELTGPNQWQDHFMELREKGFLVLESRHRKKDGSTFPVEISVRMATLEGTSYLIGVARDITGRKAAEAAIQASLREKEILLREIHHRVKNNLQIISSLFYFQAKKLRDPAGLAAFRTGQERLMSMILVHEKLYRSPDLARIDFGEYVRALTNQILQSYADVRDRIRITVESGQIFLPMETALPCGMIINELVTNIFKYAFPGNRTGDAMIRISREGERLLLTVRDTGAGLPPGTDADNPSTFGLQLIKNLTLQLNGTISIETGPGVTVTATFPLEEEGERQ